jgi:DNA polymerase-3 subunit gamma/tau
VYEFRTISARTIADQLRRIVDAEGIAVADDSLQLIARDAEGSMRDAQSKLDQVIAFTGSSVAAEDVATVLGLVGRDLLLDAVEAVANDDAPAAFTLTARAVEMGYDLRAVCRELSRVVRDLLVLSVDPSRAADPEIAGEGERARLETLAARFSREDLLRAFDLLTKAEMDIRGAAQPRYHLEMALLRWIYLRKLVPIEELIASAGSARPAASPAPTSRPPAAPARPGVSPAPGARPAAPQPIASAATSARPAAPQPTGAARPEVARGSQPRDEAAARTDRVERRPEAAPAGGFKDALLAEIRRSKMVFYSTVCAQAQRIEAAGDRVTFTFSPNQRTLLNMFEQNRQWLETVAQQVAGRRITVTGALAEGAPAAGGSSADASNAAKDVADRKTALRERALADAGVQAMLEVFPAEIRDVEEM